MPICDFEGVDNRRDELEILTDFPTGKLITNASQGSRLSLASRRAKRQYWIH